MEKQLAHRALQRRIAQLQIKTKKLLRGATAGPYVMRRIGTGSEFDQLRDYQVGDNVRAIDWKSSARSNKLIVRSYREDRNRTIILLVDTSRSGQFASGDQLKATTIQDIAVMLSFAAEQSRDRVGALFFHHAIEKVIPLGSGKTHTALLVQEIMAQQPEDAAKAAETSLAHAFTTTLEHFPKNALVVLISDCLSRNYERVMSSVARRHELVVLRVADPVEKDLPEGLLIQCEDPETGTTLQGTDPSEMDALRRFIKRWYAEQDLFLKKWGVDCCDITIGSSADELLMKFFAQRCL